MEQIPKDLPYLPPIKAAFKRVHNLFRSSIPALQVSTEKKGKNAWSEASGLTGPRANWRVFLENIPV